MSALRLKYDVGLDQLEARVGSTSNAGTTVIERGRIIFHIDAAHKSVVAFEIADFSHFVTYHVLGELFGDEVIRKIAAFQSSAVARKGPLQKTIEFTRAPSPRVIEDLLKAA
jgi:hypothetical protein